MLNCRYDVAAKAWKTEFLQDIIKRINLLKEVLTVNASTVSALSKIYLLRLKQSFLIN